MMATLGCTFLFFFIPLLVETRLGFCPPAGVSYVAPHLNNLYFLTLCQRYGVYQVIRWLFMLKLGLAVAMLLAGADHVYLLCIFIARYTLGHALPCVTPSHSSHQLRLQQHNNMSADGQKMVVVILLLRPIIALHFYWSMKKTFP